MAQKRHVGSLTDAQFRDELHKCESCEEKPCKEACPADCSPADFIMASRMGGPSDFRRAAAIIMGSNPLGGTCGALCPEYLCMHACVRRTFDQPVNIPAVQSTIIAKAYSAGMPGFVPRPPNGMKVAVIGAGPAGLGGAAVLGQLGYSVDLFDMGDEAGGMCHYIPESRLERKVLEKDIEFTLQLGDIHFISETTIFAPSTLLKGGEYKAILVTIGQDLPIAAGVPGGEHAVSWQRFLESRQRASLKNKRVMIIGGGAIAVDCATTAVGRGAAHVELLYRRKAEHMPLTAYERDLLLAHGVEVTSGTRVTKIVSRNGRVAGVQTLRQYLPSGKKADPRSFAPDRAEKQSFRSCDLVVAAIGSSSSIPVRKRKGLFFAGDMVHGAATVVEAVASGKNAAAEIDAFISHARRPRKEPGVKSRVILAGRTMLPVPLKSDFFGRVIHSPFLLSAAPHTDGYEQMKKAYEAGWAGGIMKTAFSNVHIHIPGEYMVVFGESTYGNCDNVSGHDLQRVVNEVGRLVRDYPDRLTMASTGGPVTGADAADRAVWQANTRRLEDAGAMGIEYSLSCPQGGDGTKGDMVSQDAGLTAKVIEWVMEAGDPEVPKLFKLSGAVTSIRAIMLRVRDVLQRYPGKKAGVTLANSFPTLSFRAAPGRRWDEGVIVGMSGEGVLPISNLTLARAAGLGVTISGNGGPMDYRAAANFLALGASTVQFCTIVMKYGLGIVDELQSGLSYLLSDRGMASVAELIGSALPVPITPFDDLPVSGTMPQLTASLCTQCGNCTRCPYLAIALDAKRYPVINPAFCVGCSLCAQKCFAGALQMRLRTPAEASMAQETS
jgi:NADPH-dependent glutamate synthase beta subunit-like oxidoreductase/dihydroorotate dehydrogenase/Pyruvate/2-oxoacid:ferredoxin oxidoreductase delta subunit